MENMNNNILALKVSDDFFATSKNIDLKKTDEKTNRNFFSCFEEAESIIENKNTDKKSSMINTKNDNIGEEIDSELDSLNILLIDISLFLKELETKIDSHELKKIDGKIIPILENISEKISEEIIGKEFLHYDISNNNILNNNETVNNILNQLSDIIELFNTLEKKLDKSPLSTIERSTLTFIINEIRDNIFLIKKEIESVREKTSFIENNVKNKMDLDGKDFSNNMDFFDETKNETEYVLKDAEVESLKSDIEPESIDSEEVRMKPIFINSEKNLIFENKIETMENRPVEISKEELIKQIVDKANIILDEDSSEIRIKLKPEVLGELLLKVEVEKGVVVAKAIVDNYRAKELIETNLLQLKEGLEEQGLDIKTFKVQIGNNSDFDREQREEFFQNNRKNKKIKFRKESISNINNYEENIISDGSILLSDRTLDLKA